MAEEQVDLCENLENLSTKEKNELPIDGTQDRNSVQNGLPLNEVYKLALSFYKGNFNL